MLFQEVSASLEADALEVFDVLGLEAYSDEERGEVLDAGDVGEDAKGERRMDFAGVIEDAGEDAVGEDLDALGVADGGLAVVLYLAEMMLGEGV